MFAQWSDDTGVRRMVGAPTPAWRTGEGYGLPLAGYSAALLAVSLH